MCKAEDDTFASDRDVLRISKRLIRQNKEAYEVLAGIQMERVSMEV